VNELSVRAVAGIAMIAIAVAAAMVGGYPFAVLVALAATAVFYEWTKLTRGWRIAWPIIGFLYCLAAALALLWIREHGDPQLPNGGLVLTFWVFLVTWSTDIGAYFAGRAFGTTKLAPSISPGKTWAGLWGGMGAAALVGALWTWASGLSFALLPLAPLFAAVAQGGDLFESWMKRQAGVKDSGNWIPGHGGVFDRLDGLLPVAILTALAAMAGLGG
jgi:phosphatidate cytidylyltransferase